MKPHDEHAVSLLTLDVEDWDHANYSQLDSRKGEIRKALLHRAYPMERNIEHWIELVRGAGAGSTCFVLGEFAQRYPASVRKLGEAGFEIASHGDTHDLIYGMERETFREYLKRALGVLGELTGRKPIGFRAPSWSVSPEKTPWFEDELLEAGLRYDSSEFPVRTPLFGVTGGAMRPYTTAGGLLRVPVSVLRLGPARIPFSSGAFFRLWPLWVIRWGLNQALRQKRPAMVVLHPRELDPEHPRLPISGWEGAVHYARLHTTERKLKALLSEHRFQGIEAAFGLNR